MVQVNGAAEKVYSNAKTALNPEPPEKKSVLLFLNNCDKQVGDTLNLSLPIMPPPDGNDTIRNPFNPQEMSVIEFYSNGMAHYISDYVDNIIVKRTEYTGDGYVIAKDEYSNGVLQRHIENYPWSNDVWTILEYRDGRPSRALEYTPDGKCCTDRDLTDE